MEKHWHIRQRQQRGHCLFQCYPLKCSIFNIVLNLSPLILQKEIKEKAVEVPEEHEQRKWWLLYERLKKKKRYFQRVQLQFEKWSKNSILLALCVFHWHLECLSIYFRGNFYVDSLKFLTHGVRLWMETPNTNGFFCLSCTMEQDRGTDGNASVMHL